MIIYPLDNQEFIDAILKTSGRGEKDKLFLMLLKNEMRKFGQMYLKLNSSYCNRAIKDGLEEMRYQLENGQIDVAECNLHQMTFLQVKRNFIKEKRMQMRSEKKRKVNSISHPRC